MGTHVLFGQVPVEDVSGLTVALAAKAPLSHVHLASDITSGVFDIARIPTGTSGSTVALGNDARIVGAVQSTRSVLAGTGLTGGGTLAADRTLAVAYGATAATAVQGNDARVVADQAAAVASIRTLGTGALQAAAGDDARFTGAVAYSRLPVGSSVSTVAAGDDARIVGATPSTRSILAGTGLTGGGTLAADRTLAVAYGATAATAVQGNDARVVADQAAGTASIRTLGTGALQAAAGNHGHAAADITSGSLATARMPKTTSTVRTVGFSATPTIDPAVDGNLVDIAATGAITALAVSTTGATNRQTIEIAVSAAAAQNVTFAAAIRTSTGITRGPYAIPAGQVLIAAVKYSAAISAWMLVAATVSAT